MVSGISKRLLQGRRVRELANEALDMAKQPEQVAIIGSRIAEPLQAHVCVVVVELLLDVSLVLRDWPIRFHFRVLRCAGYVGGPRQQRNVQNSQFAWIRSSALRC